MFGSVIAILSLIIALVATAYSRRSADAARASAEAAARSATAAEKAVDLETSGLRDRWIDRFAETLPDWRQVKRLVPTLPEVLRTEWRDLIIAAWGRNPRAVGDLSGRLYELGEELDNEDAHDDSL